MPVPLALDAQAERLYVSLSPSRTVVLDADTLASVDEIPFGGTLSVDPAANRLYMGVPGSYAYRADGSSVIMAAELNMPSFDDPRSFDALFAPDEFTTDGALFHTRDDGATWNTVNSWPLNTALSVSNTLYVAITQNGPAGLGIWRSYDGGQTWLPASHGLTDLAITRLAVSPDFAHDGTLYALSKRGMFRSVDRGESWVSLADRYAPLLKNLTVSFTSLAVSSNFAQDDTLLIGHSSGLWRSTDRGETWTKINDGPPATRLAYAPDGSMVLAADYEGIHRSTDGGLTWQLFNTGLDLNNRTVSEVQINDREAVVLLTSFDQPGAVYRLPPNETTWQRVPIELDVTALAALPEGGLLIGTRDGAVRRYP